MFDPMLMDCFISMSGQKVMFASWRAQWEVGADGLFAVWTYWDSTGSRWECRWCSPPQRLWKKALFMETECPGVFEITDGNTQTNDLVLWMTPTDLISKLCEGADSGGTLDQAQSAHDSLFKFLCSVIMDILLSKQGTWAIFSLLCVCKGPVPDFFHLLQRRKFNLLCQNSSFKTVHLILFTSSHLYFWRLFVVCKQSGSR